MPPPTAPPALWGDGQHVTYVEQARLCGNSGASSKRSSKGSESSWPMGGSSSMVSSSMGSSMDMGSSSLKEPAGVGTVGISGGGRGAVGAVGVAGVGAGMESRGLLLESQKFASL